MRTFFFLILVSLPALGQSTCAFTKERIECVKYLHNYDGDTVTFKLPVAHPLYGDKAKVRVLGIDTAEMKPGKKASPCEKEWAKVAKAFVAAELSKAKKINLTQLAGLDSFGRILAAVEYDDKDLKTLLLKDNLAVPYLGKKKVRVDWCEIKNKRKS